MAETKEISRLPQEGANLYEGVDSFSHPLFIKQTQYRWAENCVNRGGVVQTRPGNKQRLEIDVLAEPFLSWWQANGNPDLWPQGFCIFAPSSGELLAVFAVSGSVFYAPMNPDGSIGAAAQIPNAQLSQYAAQIVFTPCVQSVDINGQGVKFPIYPKPILMIQDGSSRAIAWDGVSARTMNPGKRIATDSTGNTLYPPGYNETRIGLWCAWSGNRYWVGNGRQFNSSDIGDPTHFTEELITTQVPQIVFPDDIRGVIDRGTSGTSKSIVLVGTEKGIFAIWSGLQDRTQWNSTADFVSQIFAGTGCLAGKSFVVHRGLLYWRSEDGIVVFDSTQTVYSTQLLPPCDYEMSAAKDTIGPDLSLMCAGYRDAYVFWSAPFGPTNNGRICNGQTLVLDRQTITNKVVGMTGPFTYGTAAWQGVWTGVRPVEWATRVIAGQTRTYCFSIDSDGVPRIWEAFQGNRTDNGTEIPWYMMTRAHPFGPSTPFEFSKFRNFRLILGEMLGNVTLSGYWKGLRGEWHLLLNSLFLTATPGSVLSPAPGNTPITPQTSFNSNTVQSRYIRSPDVRGNSGCDPACTSAGVEYPKTDQIDNAFMLLFKFTGRAAIVAYQINADAHEDESQGEVMTDESGFNILPEAGCPEHVDLPAGQAQPDYNLPDAPIYGCLRPTSSRFLVDSLYHSPPV